MARNLVVKVTCGVAEAERCNQGFTVAATAASAGLGVSLWLTGDAAWLALPGRAAELQLELATPLVELLRIVLEAGSVTVCAQCAARRGIEEGALVAGVRIAGAAAYVDEITRDGVQAIVY